MTSRLLIVWSILWAPLWLLVLHPIWRRVSVRERWVIGGHRGRLYADNSSEVERAARTMGIDVVWIANEPLSSTLKERGIDSLARGSWGARRAISTARVLIYSHGEDDLDLLLLLLRRRTAPRVYLGHSLSLLKAGGVLDPPYRRAGALRRLAIRTLMTDSDVILAASDPERQTLVKQYPGRLVRLGGGAHLQAWVKAARRPQMNRIYWFPTFRDTGRANRRLASMIERVASSERLRSFLTERGAEMYIGTHINLGPSRLQVQPPFFVRSSRDLVTEVATSQVLVSDYSGVMFDFLLTERPQIFFPFDLKDYLSRRALLTAPEEMRFALRVDSAEQLVDALVSQAYDDEHLRAATKAERLRCLPRGKDNFAEASVHAIRDFLSEGSRVH